MSGALTPQILLRAYAAGIFPMAQSRSDDTLHWIDPRRRGVFPLDGFHVSRSLARRIRRMPFRVQINGAFDAVLEYCADRPETWINAPLVALYRALHDQGHAHSLEIWENENLIGGVFGISLGGAFFGESMFSRCTDGSKIALAVLIDQLRAGGFQLFDTQFLTPHLASLGAIEISRTAYHARLAMALKTIAHFPPLGPAPNHNQLVQRITQTS